MKKWRTLAAGVALAALASVGLPQAASAQSLFGSGTQRPGHSGVGGDYVGLLLGPAIISDNIGTKFAIGADVNIMMTDQIGAGLYVTYNGMGDNAAASSNLWNILAEGNYFLTEVPGLRVGAKLGVGISSVSPKLAGVNSTSDTDPVIGFHAGYDYVVANQISVGPEVNFLFVTSNPGVTILNILGAVKYWF